MLLPWQQCRSDISLTTKPNQGAHTTYSWPYRCPGAVTVYWILSYYGDKNIFLLKLYDLATVVISGRAPARGLHTFTATNEERLL